MERVCREGDGLFPSPGEIKLSCSCPDWADMCKHVAATLYGVGARLDEKPQLLFKLRGVDENELIASAGEDLSLSKKAPSRARVLNDSDVAALFGLEMAETENPDTSIPTAPRRPQRSKRLMGGKTPAGMKTTVAKKRVAKKSNSPSASRTKPESKWVALVRARKRRAQRLRAQRSV